MTSKKKLNVNRTLFSIHTYGLHAVLHKSPGGIKEPQTYQFDTLLNCITLHCLEFQQDIFLKTKYSNTCIPAMSLYMLEEKAFFFLTRTYNKELIFHLTLP